VSDFSTLNTQQTLNHKLNMPDPTPTPPPASAPKVNRSTSNQDSINSLKNTGQIVAAAQKTEYAPVFTAGGITAAKLTALATDIAAALALAGDATTARATLEAAIKSIIARRREIQFAADAKWPPSDPANAGIRREFRLSPDKPMK
jgi:hypothetical protein